MIAQIKKNKTKEIEIDFRNSSLNTYSRLEERVTGFPMVWWRKGVIGILVGKMVIISEPKPFGIGRKSKPRQTEWRENEMTPLCAQRKVEARCDVWAIDYHWQLWEYQLYHLQIINRDSESWITVATRKNIYQCAVYKNRKKRIVNTFIHFITAHRPRQSEERKIW